MDFRVLGPLEVRDGESVVPLGGPKRRAVVALLLLDANRVVPAERLVDELWGDDPPPAAHSSLHNHVSRLRRVLGDRLTTRPPGYLLRVEAGELDLERFRRLVADARGAEPAAAATRLRDALALWRGPPLADLAGEPAHAALAHLDELHLAALEERIDADLALGRHADLVHELQGLVAEHPLRERLWAQLVLALYRSGRQADALDAYARVRRSLVDELGTEPGPELQELQRRVLRHDPSLVHGDTREAGAAGPPKPVLDETRRTVTVLAAALAPVAALDPEARREAVRHHVAAARRTLELHGGTPQDLAPERVVGVFGAPVAHEDDALRAVRAAFDLRAANAVSAVGVATGEVITGSAPGDALVSGAPLELAERLCAGGGDGVVVCERTWRLVRHATRAARVEGGYRLARVDAEAPTLVRHLETPLVGREDELAEVVRAFERACRETRPRLLTIFGEPGIGKTRLFAEAAARLADEATVLVARCSAYGDDATYAPLREVVVGGVGGTTDGLRALMEGEPEGELVATRVAAAVGAGPAAGSVEETAWAVRRLLETLARRRPVVLALEDAHWAAPALLDLVEHVVDVGRAPILVVCLARPELVDVRAAWAGGKLNSASLMLGGLSVGAAERLLQELAPGGALAGDDRARIVEVADGNPLYIEQLLAAALDDAREGVPDSIHALIAARLDRLPADERRVLEAAAACGATFSAAAVGELVGGDARRRLESLVRRDLLRPADVPLFGEETWAFRHALVHDAAYRSVPKRRRARLHEAYAARVERLEDERGLELDELVGYHLEQAVRAREDIGEDGAELHRLALGAARRLAAAGIREWDRNDGTAAAALLRRAVAFFPEDDPKRGEALLMLSRTATWRGDKSEAPRLLAQARASAARHEDARLLARVTIKECDVALWTGGSHPTERLLDDVDRAIAVLEEAGDDRGLAEAFELRFHLLDRGAATSSPRAALLRAVHHARRAGSANLEAWAQAWICITLPRSDDPVPACVDVAEEALRTAPTLAGRAAALGALGQLEAMQGNFAEARRLVLEDDAILAELGLDQARAAHTIARAEVEMMAGDLRAAEDLLRSGYERVVAFHDQNSIANVAWRLALVLTHSRRDDEAEAFTRVAEETTPHGFWVDVWWAVVRAVVCARAGRVAESDDLLATAFRLLAAQIETGMHADAWIEAAEVHRAAGRLDAADELLARAAALARRLGYVVAERRAEELRRR